MATTWSFKLLAFTWMLRRTARVSLRMCFDIGLKFQPRFPGRRGQGFHSSVVHITAAIEHHLFDSGSAGAVIDDLRVDVPVRAVHTQPRALRRSRHARTHAKVNPLAVRVTR